MTRNARKINPQDTYHFDALRTYIASVCPEYARLTLLTQRRLAGIVQASMFQQNRHKLDDELQVLHHQALRRLFKSGGFERLMDTLGWYTAEIAPSNVTHIATGWRVTDELWNIIEGFNDAVSGKGAGLMVDDSGRPAPKARKPVASNTTTGSKSRFRGCAMRVPVEVNGDALEALAQAAEAFLDGEPCPDGYEGHYAAWSELGGSKGRERARRVAAQARLTLEASRQTRVEGFVLPMTYIEVGSGRIYANGSPNLQGCCREVKAAALRGCYELDMENCHWDLLMQLAKRIAPTIELPAIARYLADKQGTRAAIAAEARIPIKASKTALIALVYGARLTSTVRKPKAGERVTVPAMVGAAGKDGAARLCASQTMRALNADVAKARELIVEHYSGDRRKGGVVVNDAGRELPLGPKVKDRHILSHILQGIESECLRACMDAAGASLVLVQHDGFTSRTRLDKGRIKGAIRLRTGFDLELSEDVL